MKDANYNRLFQHDQFDLEQLIRAGAAWLDAHSLCYGHGTDNPLDESSWIALEACQLSPLQSPDYTLAVSVNALQRAREWYRRRVDENIPVAYLTGRCWFAGHEFICDSRALIPRSPIAELVQQRFAPWLLNPPASALDLCCGGGSIAIALALEFENSRVDAADISTPALNLAKANREKHELQHRLQYYCGDLFAALPHGSRYDLVVSNPPYVDKQDMDALPAEYSHEPVNGLGAGDDGLDIVRRILVQAADYLQPDGWLVVETGNAADAVIEEFPDMDFIWLEFADGGDGVFLLPASALV